ALSKSAAGQALPFHDGGVNAAIFLRDGASPPAGRTRVLRSGRRASRRRRRCSRGMRLRWSRLRCRLMAARSPPRPESDSEAKAWLTAFEEGLQKLGWSQDSNLRIDYRWAGNDEARLRSYVAALVETAALSLT